MLKHIRLIRHSLAVVFLLLLSTYYVNTTMFWHSHIVDGVSVVHSHMHLQQHHKSLDGGHTVLQISLITLLQEMLLFTGAAVFCLIAPIFTLHYDKRQWYQSICLGYSHYSSLRAPPTL